METVARSEVYMWEIQYKAKGRHSKNVRQTEKKNHVNKSSCLYCYPFGV